MTYKEAVKLLSDSGSESGRYEAGRIFCGILGIPEWELPLVADKDFESSELSEAIERRASGYPLQYILGEWDFFGLTFEVNESCLCPRPDTETAVETAIKLIPEKGRFLELCTGSGCIPISVCRYRPDTAGVAVELYEKTLEVAKRNAEKNGVSDRITFLGADVFDLELWESGKGKSLLPPRGFDAIISNPPYIPSGDIDGLSKEVMHEPRAALDGGEDGLDFYRAIVSGYGRYLSANGVMIFEIGYDQGDAICEIAAKNGYACRTVKDLGGNDRVAVLNSKFER